MTVALDAKAVLVTASTANTGTITNTTLTIGPAGTLVIGVFAPTVSTTAPPCVPRSMSWNGIPMTFIGSKTESDGFSSVYVYALINPTPGNKTLSCTYTPGSGINTGNYLDCFSFSGTDTTSIANCIPAANILSDASTPPGPVYPAVPFAISTNAGDAACAVMNGQNESFSVSNIGTLINANAAINGNYASLYNPAIGGATTQLQFAGSVNPNPCCALAFRIAQASAAPPAVAKATIPVTGSSADIVNRVKGLIPNRWFRYVAPYRDAILGALADLAAWNYGLILYARAQSRLATAYGIWLDIFAYDFLGRFLTRNGAADDTFRAIIRATILQERVTRNGMINAITTLTGTAPSVFEPWNTQDTGGYSSPGHNSSYQTGSFGYNVGKGGYGNMQLNNQVFIQIVRGSGSGVPGVGGYGNNLAGYGVGAMEYVGPSSELWGITDAMIYDMINKTKPTGTTCWVQFQIPTLNLVSESGILLKDETGNIQIVSK